MRTQQEKFLLNPFVIYRQPEAILMLYNILRHAYRCIKTDQIIESIEVKKFANSCSMRQRFLRLYAMMSMRAINV